MGVRLGEEETWAFLEQGHTAVLTTLRRDGSPASVPMWFVVDGRSLCVRTLAHSKKAANMRRDPRVSLVVEEGLAWADLKAVVLAGQASEVADEAEQARLQAAFDEKYRDFKAPPDLPQATRRHYAAAWSFFRIEPRGRTLTWANAKLLGERA